MSDNVLFPDFFTRGRRTVGAPLSVTEPEPPEPDEDAVGIREQFLEGHYWNSRNLLDEVLDAEDDDTYRRAIAILREAIDRYPT